MNELGIERLSVFGMPPVAFVNLAADLGCQRVGLGLEPMMRGFNPDRHPPWSLREDAALRSETRAALADRGLSIGVVEGFALMPGQDIRAATADLDLVAELGAERIACVSLDQDMARTIEGFSVLADLAAERDLLVSAEMGSLGPYGLVAAALELVRGVGRDHFTLMIDAMHYFRLGNTAEELATIPPSHVGYVQLCDAPRQQRFDTYMEEALYERMVPGEGELPLGELIDWLPAGVVVSLEMPRRALAEQGVGPRERLAPCVAAAKALLAARIAD